MEGPVAPGGYDPAGCGMAVVCFIVVILRARGFGRAESLRSGRLQPWALSS